MNKQYKIESRQNNERWFNAGKSFLYSIGAFIGVKTLFAFGGLSAIIAIISAILGIACFIKIFVCLAEKEYQVYVIKCPYCGQTVDFPVNEDGWNCSCCENRMVKVDGIIKKVGD